ncbi:MAG: bacteriocin [Oscillospiraceae bacterium]
MKTIEEFYSEAMADKALANAAYKARKEERLAEFLSEHEVNGTAEEFNSLVEKMKKAACELSDDELDNVSGGTYGYVDWNQDWAEHGGEYDPSKIVYLFDINDKVAVDCWFRNLTGKVTARKIESKGLCYYPAYYIEFDIDTSSDWYFQNYLVRI